MSGRNNRQPPPPPGITRVSFVGFNVEGDPAAITKLSDSFFGAMRANGYALSMPVNPTPPVMLPAAKPAAAEPAAQTSFDEMLVPTPPPAPIEMTPAPIATQQTTQPRRRHPPKSPELSTHLNPGERPSLTDFVAKTTVTKDSSASDQATVIAMWMKEDRNLTEMTGNDYYTCCKFLGWSYPADITSTLRNMKREDMVSSKGGKYSITIIGEKHFETLLKR